MNIIDDDKSFGIDVGTRDITYSGEGKIRLIQGDHNSERITFSMNRYVEQYDMSQCDKVEIHYINISSSGKERSEGVYTVADVEINPTSENEIVFSWLVSVNATCYAGSVNFLILFRNVDAEGNVTYSWSTALNKEIIIGEGMNCGDDFEEAYSDILAQWEKKVAADIKADAMADEIKQNKTDDALTTEDKTIVGAINETARKQERLQYYGDANIVPTDMANFKFTVDGGTASIDGFADDTNVSNIVIPYQYTDEEGNEYPVTAISEKAFQAKDLMGAIIPETVTYIGAYAFAQNGLNEIILPDSIKYVGEYAFQNNYISAAKISNSITAIPEGMFALCPIKEIVIPDSVTSIGAAGFVFAKDTHVVIPHNVASLGNYAFEMCQNLLEVEILNDNITISDDAFVDCTNVTIICGEGSTAEAFCKAHSIPYRYNTVTDDFIIYGELGIVGPVLTLTDVSVGFSDISEAFQSGKNILMQLYYPDLNVTVRMPLVAYNDNIIVFSFVDHEAILYALTWTSENIAICHVIRLASQEYVGEHVDETWQWKTALEERITTLETALASYKTSLNEKVEYAEWEAHEADMMNLVIDNQKSIAALEEEISGVNADLEAALEGDV